MTSRILKWRVWLAARTIPFKPPAIAYVYMYGADQSEVETVARQLYGNVFWFIESAEDC